VSKDKHERLNRERPRAALNLNPCIGKKTIKQKGYIMKRLVVPLGE
jgi:hypothetical protein